MLVCVPCSYHSCNLQLSQHHTAVAVHCMLCDGALRWGTAAVGLVAPADLIRSNAYLFVFELMHTDAQSVCCWRGSWPVAFFVAPTILHMRAT